MAAISREPWRWRYLTAVEKDLSIFFMCIRLVIDISCFLRFALFLLFFCSRLFSIY